MVIVTANQHTGYGVNVCSSDIIEQYLVCLLYTSDAADERSSVDLGGRRIIKKKQIGRRYALPGKAERDGEAAYD